MISTKDIPSGGSSIPKVLQPGNRVFTINKVTLDEVPYKAGAYNMSIHVESEDLGESFEGFYIDKDQPELGRYKGQIGKIRLSEWPYSDGETKSGIKISRDMEILKSIRNLCIESDATAWLESQDNEHDTIESLVEAFNNDKPFKGKSFYACVAGREYLNKAGYMNYDLYLPKVDKGQSSFKKESNSEKVPTFNEEKHIKKSKTDTVSSFGTTTTPDNDYPDTEIIPTTLSIGSDFDLD
jgi:hypothetical protein